MAAAFSALVPDDQLGVLNDTNALAFSGIVPMSAFLDIAANFPANADPVVVSAWVDMLRELDLFYRGKPTQAGYRAYELPALNRAFARVGWDEQSGESDNVGLLRSDLIAALSDCGDASVIAQARGRFRRYLTDDSLLDPDARRSVLGAVALHADLPAWEEIHTLAKTAKSEIERSEYYVLLAAADDPALVQRALDLTASGEPPTTVIPAMVSRAARRHPKLALSFAVTHWDTLAPLIEPTSQARFVPGLLLTASEPELIAELHAFAERHIPPGALQDVHKADSNIRYHAAIRKDRLPAVDAWLHDRG